MTLATNKDYKPCENHSLRRGYDFYYYLIFENADTISSLLLASSQKRTY